MFYVKDLTSESSNNIDRVDTLDPFQEKNEAGEVVFTSRYAAATREKWVACQNDEDKALIADGGFPDELPPEPASTPVPADEPNGEVPEEPVVEPVSAQEAAGEASAEPAA